MNLTDKTFIVENEKNVLDMAGNSRIACGGG